MDFKTVDMKNKEKLSNSFRHDKHIQYMIVDRGETAIKSMFLINVEF